MEDNPTGRCTAEQGFGLIDGDLMGTGSQVKNINQQRAQTKEAGTEFRKFVLTPGHTLAGTVLHWMEAGINNSITVLVYCSVGILILLSRRIGYMPYRILL